MKYISKIKRLTPVIRFLPWTIYFNFRYLPFKQAYHLPILLYKPTLLKMKGRVILETKAKYGTVRLGFHEVSIFPNSGITWENSGGTIIFKGKCEIGNNSFITIGTKGEVIFGDDFRNATSLKLIAHRKIEFGQKMRVGWDCIIMDNNFHPLFDISKGVFKRASGNIKFGDCNWLGSRCVVMHGVETSERAIFGLGSILTRGVKSEPYCVHGGSPVRVLSRNVMRDYDNEMEII